MAGKKKPKKKTTKKKPSKTGSNGRDSKGRFIAGNKAAKGNPHAGKMARLRSAMLDAVKEADLKAVFKKLVEQAKEGDIPSIRELFNRAIGKATEPKEEAGIFLDLPPIQNIGDTVTAASKVLKAMASGNITADEAMKLSSVIELTRRTLETSKMEQRMRRLEELYEAEQR